MARHPGIVESVISLALSKRSLDILTAIITSTCAPVICAESFAKHGKPCESISDAITNKARIWSWLILDILLKTKAEADVEISGMMFSSQSDLGKCWSCSLCDFSNKRKELVYRHVDRFHYGFSYNCDVCGKISPTLHAMEMNCRCHKKEYYWS